ncbi:MAG: hypothetical protein SF053_08340 [Bacteroidia bacterium]|nr:hypothetical protein [Bacteroidia bacterium]
MAYLSKKFTSDLHTSQVFSYIKMKSVYHILNHNHMTTSQRQAWILATALALSFSAGLHSTIWRKNRARHCGEIRQERHMQETKVLEMTIDPQTGEPVLKERSGHQGGHHGCRRR